MAARNISTTWLRTGAAMVAMRRILVAAATLTAGTVELVIVYPASKPRSSNIHTWQNLPTGKP
jgi:hypothetical protein